MIIVIIMIIIVILIIYFHCPVILYYHLTQNMDTIIPVMTIFLAEAHSPSWSPFILLKNKEIKRIISSDFLFLRQ